MDDYEGIVIVERNTPMQVISNHTYLRYNYISVDKIKIFFLNRFNKEAYVISDLNTLSNKKQIKTLNRWDFKKDTLPNAPYS